jgi:PAS domain S-box-containing protein
MKPMDRIRNRLESLLSGLLDSIPRTGSLEAVLRKTEEPWHTEGFVWESDVEGKFVWVSPEIEKVLGYAPDDLIGQAISSIALPTSGAEELQNVLAEGQPVYNLRVQAKNKDGDEITLILNALARADSDGERTGHRGVAQVVKPEIREEELPVVETPEQISELYERLDIAVPSSWGDIHGYVDDEEGLRPIEPTETVPDTSELIGEGKLVVPIQAGDAMLGLLEFEEPSDGHWDDDAKALAEAVAQDLAVTLQSAQTHQLTRQALDEMREADRLKTQFLANMSHELRTPLNSIIGFSRVILKGIDGPITETQEQDLTAIYNAGHHLLGLINDILDVSRIEAGKMELTFEDVNLTEIVHGVMSTAVGLVKDRPIMLITDVPDDLPTIQADKMRIRQVLLNLVSNAAKFTQEGKISVSARVVEQDGTPSVVVTVYDTGPGITPEDQEKLFEPFSQVDDSPTRKTGGTGLGLSICRHLVELHGGKIWVTSKIDSGSTFAFTIPIQASSLVANP